MIRYLAIVVAMQLAGCATTRTGRELASSSPPVNSSWTRSYSIRAFEREIRREDQAARTLEASGGFFIRTFPSPEKWRVFKKEHPGIRFVGRYQPDPGKKLPVDEPERAWLRSDHKYARGAGFVAIDQTGTAFLIHESIAYWSSSVVPQATESLHPARPEQLP